MLNDDWVNMSGTGKIEGLLLLRLPLKTSGLSRLGLFCGISKWFPTLNVGGPSVGAGGVFVNSPIDSFKFGFDSFLTEFGILASVIVAKN